MPDLFVAEGYLESCRAWQEAINRQPTLEERVAASEEAQIKLGDETPHGVNRVIVHGDEALFVPDGSDPDDERIRPLVRISNIATRGWLARPSVVQSGENVSLAWPVLNPSVIRIGEEATTLTEAMDIQVDEDGSMIPLHQRIKRTLHFPVSFIKTTMPYDDRLIIPSTIPTN